VLLMTVCDDESLSVNDDYSQINDLTETIAESDMVRSESNKYSHAFK